VGSVVAAISISGPASRLTPDRFVSQGELVRETANLNITKKVPLKRAGWIGDQSAWGLRPSAVLIFLAGIASAVYDDVGSVVAAISISGPASRLTPDRFVSQAQESGLDRRSVGLGFKAQCGTDIPCRLPYQLALAAGLFWLCLNLEKFSNTVRL
jgi:hypothetical protein